MKIAARMEGGIGDHLLSNRFVHAIKDKHPDSEICIFSDTENNPNQMALLSKLWPSIYKNYKVLGKRKDANFKIKSAFGNETYPSHISNMAEGFDQEILNFDKFYDLHIDGLKWLNADFDWLRYYYFFPKPEIDLTSPYSGEYIMAHLYSRPDSPYNLENWYVISLLKKLTQTTKVVIITLKEHESYYEEIFNNENIVSSIILNYLICNK
jgi:ADP-heptose:LPS heptosyltransferase